MKTRASIVSIAILSTTFLLLIGSLGFKRHASAQQPAQPTQPRTAEQAFKNIKVLKTMPAGQLQNAMSFIAASLGVDCSHCHTQPAMEKDDKPTKETARRMLAMVNEINKNFTDRNMVSCATCHRGKPKPVAVPPLPSIAASFTASNPNVTQQPLPTVDAIVDRYVNALGGMQAFEKVTTLSRKGAVALRGLQGSFELYEAAPNKTLLIGSLPAPVGSMEQGFDGTTGWVKNQNGVFDMTGDGLVQAKREAPFYRDVRLKEQFKEMSVAGRELVDNREFYMVVGTRPDGEIERLYFDVQTGLLRRRYWETPTYFGPLPNSIDYDDYRKVGKVRLPFSIRRARAGSVFLQTVTEYKLNIAVDDARFKKPDAKK